MVDPMYVELGAALRRRRDEVGMTQADLAARLGLSRTSVTNIECGRQPMLVHQLIHASTILEVNAVDIVKVVAPTKPDGAKDEDSAKFEAALSKLKPRRKAP